MHPIRVYSDFGYGLVIDIGAESATLAEWMLFYEDVLGTQGYTKPQVGEYAGYLRSLWDEHGRKQPKKAFYIEDPIHIIVPVWAKWLKVGFNASVNTLFDQYPVFIRCQSAVLLSTVRDAGHKDGLYEISPIEIKA